MRLRTHHGWYVRAEDPSGRKDAEGRAIVDQSKTAGPWEDFTLIRVGAKVAFRTAHGTFLRASDAEHRINQTHPEERDALGPWELFEPWELVGCAWRTHHGTWLRASQPDGHEQGALTQDAGRTVPGPWERFRVEGSRGSAELSGGLVARPVISDFLGPLPDGQTDGLMGTGYFSPSLCSIQDPAQRQAILARQKANGAVHFQVWAQWSNNPEDRRGEFPVRGWSGPRTFDAYADRHAMTEFGHILDEIVSAGLSPIVVVAERAQHTFGAMSVRRIVDEMAAPLVGAFGRKIAWLIPEFESDEIRDADERADLMIGMRSTFPRVAVHFSSHMPRRRSGYDGLPDDVLILGQAPRHADRAELRAYGTTIRGVTSGRTLINFEHSANKRLSGHSVTDQTRRALLLAEAGWEDTGNALSVEARIGGMLRHRPPSIEALTEAWPDLEIAVPGIRRLGGDTVWYPGLGDAHSDQPQRCDVLIASKSPDPSDRRWDHRVEGWDRKVR